ncbi:hypothetical protein HOY82DRAFT_582335 [Tuber indicum]|nr:hypothetical protein HOY82DRAFT_582335 [Tuber indicum]
MSTTWRENYSFPRIFKGRRERTGHGKGAVLFRPPNPSSGQTDFRRTLPRAPADVSEFSYVTVESPHPGSTNPCPTAICTRGRSTRDHSQGFVTDLHACLLATASFLRWRRADSNFHGHRPAV